MKEDLQAKERIIEAATQLIKESGHPEQVTIREVAARAAVGVGLVNYHFQTKENLINQCIQRIISKVIDQFEPLSQSLDLEPAAKLRYLAKVNLDFLINNAGFSRTSITTDMLSPHSGDNTMQTTKAYLPLLHEVCGKGIADSEILFLFHMLISTVQSAFLRKDVLSEVMGIDLSVKSQRDLFIDKIIDTVFAAHIKAPENS